MRRQGTRWKKTRLGCNLRDPPRDRRSNNEGKKWQNESIGRHEWNRRCRGIFASNVHTFWLPHSLTLFLLLHTRGRWTRFPPTATPLHVPRKSRILLSSPTMQPHTHTHTHNMHTHHMHTHIHTHTHHMHTQRQVHNRSPYAALTTSSNSSNAHHRRKESENEETSK